MKQNAIDPTRSLDLGSKRDVEEPTEHAGDPAEMDSDKSALGGVRHTRRSLVRHCRTEPRGATAQRGWSIVLCAVVSLPSASMPYSFDRRQGSGRRSRTQTTSLSAHDGLDYDREPLRGFSGSIISPPSPSLAPIVGPVLAAQMGYLPGTLWIPGGVVFAVGRSGT